MIKILKKLRWLYPGIRVKRWISLSCAGLAILIIGAVRFVRDIFPLVKALDILFILLGAGLIFSGIRSLVKSFLLLLLPSTSEELVDLVYRKRHLEKGPRIVTIGGGHGLSALLMGLKKYTTNLIAVVTVADSGGSSGKLREEFDIIPPGDIRNCLVALADAPALVGNLFQYRFKKDSALKGHNFGNLFITAMNEVTGDFKKAIEESSRVLAVRGKVLPSTLNKVSLVAEFKDGTMAEGEAVIPEKRKPIRKVHLKSLDPGSGQKIRPVLEVIEAVRNAQIIVIGPGSLYTSILPNLVIEEIAQAVRESQALKVYVCNVMTQPGETDGFTAFDHVRVLAEHSRSKIFDYCLINTKIPNEELLAKYRKENALPVIPDAARIKSAGYKVVESDLLHATDFVRHDSDKLARVIIGLFKRETFHKSI